MRFASITIGLGAACSLLLLLVSLYDRFPTVSPLSTTPTTTSVESSPVRAALTVMPNSTITTSHQVTVTPQGISSVISDVQTVTNQKWQTLANPEAGYSIRYPADVVIQFHQNVGNSSSTTSIDFQIPGQPYQGMSIRVEPNLQTLPIDKFFEEFYQEINGRPTDPSRSYILEEIEIAGMTAYVVNGLYGDLQILLPSQDKVYFFSLGYGIAGGVSSEAESLFFQILNTLQILS